MAKKRGSAATASRRIALVGADAARTLALRGGLIAALLAQRHQVHCLVGDEDPATAAALAATGATVAGYELRTRGIHPLADRRSIDALAARLAEWKPSVVVGFGLKPMVLAALAAGRVGVDRIVPLVSSLDELAQRADARPGFALRWMMRSAFKASHAVIFHNRETAAQFASQGLMPPDLPVHVVPGGGVDLDHFKAAPLPPLAPGLVFVMIARRDRAKGVIEFCQAARIVREKSKGSRFILAGPPSTGADAVGADDLASFAGVVEVAGATADVRPLLAQCHVYVLPSHAEGMPRTVVEALACGRPVITTDTPGCRDTVDERVNGVLVPPRDPAALATAMESFLKRPDLIPWMSRASRLKAERRFDGRAINAEIIDILGLESH